MTEHDPTASDESSPSWQPLTSQQRRVVGVLVEKAKTTPESYPMSLNALTNGCNQKNNRSPQMQLSADEVELQLDELREMGAVVEVQGSGRVAKYRHCMYDWLAVDKFELAVVTELLLRGEQTVGELRGRAARMETINDLGELRPIVERLSQRGLVVPLTAEGRGQVVTHGLYPPAEMDKVRSRSHEAPPQPAAPRAPSNDTGRGAVTLEAFEALRDEVAALREELQQFKQRL